MLSKNIKFKANFHMSVWISIIFKIYIWVKQNQNKNDIHPWDDEKH